MRILKWIGLTVVALALIGAAVGLWKREEITRLLAVNSLFDADLIAGNFSNMDDLFLTVPVDRGAGPVRALEAGSPMTMPDGFDAWVEARSVLAAVVLKDGAVVYENYWGGTKAGDHRVSWSVAKSFLSVLAGVLVEEGALALDDPVTRHAPKLAGSAYEGATVRDVLEMESGVAFDEDYLDPNSDINRMGRTIALGGTLDDFTAAITDRRAPPGDSFTYVSMDTHVVGMVLRGATGRTIADLLSEKVIVPLGLEGTPYYMADGAGAAFVLGGLNMPTRDYARFGQMVLDDGRVDGAQVVPADWLAASTAWSAKTAPGALKYGYQWWAPKDARPGEVFGQGVYGQYLWIDREAGVVIATNGADRGFRGAGVSDGNIAMMRAITAAARSATE
ncbi:MAG: serine hydrolase [Pseudomonadota bacterium]